MSINVASGQLGSRLRLITKFVKEVFPRVENELDGWRTRVQACPDQVLATQADASILSKRFHAQGGSVYALYPGVNQENFTRFVVALQTISDYLDNLCDRAGVQSEAAFRQLHLAMEEALNPQVPISDYYRFYPHTEDGGYLAGLVQKCREQVACWPAYHLVQRDLLHLARLYSDLQTYKHLHPDIREAKMLQWAKPWLQDYPGLTSWEFAAASGSTLGMFVLGAVATNPELTELEVQQLKQAYFPWICGLHILLDYFIDQQEDRDGGDLNFIFYYPDSAQCQKRLIWFLENAVRQIASLDNPLFHSTVLEGLLAMYLSDPKAHGAELKEISQQLLRTGGSSARIMYNLCRLLRWRKTI